MEMRSMKATKILGFFIVLNAWSSTVFGELYVDTDNPYNVGKLSNHSIVVTKDQGAPMRTVVYYPKEAGTYAVVYFVPGAPAGVIPTEFYSDLLARVAAHGFIVLGIDAYTSCPYTWCKRSFTGLPGNHLAHLNWLRGNLERFLEADVHPAWGNTALLCHSAGCDVTLGMLQQNQQAVNSTIFLEPASFSIKKVTGIKVPAYIYATEFAEEPDPFVCNIKGQDYDSFYETWGCPKWITEVADFGHCDVLDQVPWESCHILHFCKTEGKWERVFPVYHNYAAGAVSAFLTGTVQNYAQSLQYIQDTKLIPLKLVKSNFTLTC